jgi:hypothetical protein
MWRVDAKSGMRCVQVLCVDVEAFLELKWVPPQLWPNKVRAQWTYPCVATSIEWPIHDRHRGHKITLGCCLAYLVMVAYTSLPYLASLWTVTNSLFSVSRHHRIQAADANPAPLADNLKPTMILQMDEAAALCLDWTDGGRLAVGLSNGEATSTLLRFCLSFIATAVRKSGRQHASCFQVVSVCGNCVQKPSAVMNVSENPRFD